METIGEALQRIFRIAGIRSKADLDRWCGEEGRKKLYKEVEELAQNHWARINCPRATVRAEYERRLPGYKIYQV
jgi:hypothetical protein